MLKTFRNRQTSTDRIRQKCLKKFLYYFRKGFTDPKYISWEREYKETAHHQFQEHLNKKAFQSLLKDQEYSAIAALAVKIESRTNLLFSFE